MKFDLDEGLTEREYPESGTVTISTKEYRDLVMGVSGWFAKAKAEQSKYLDAWCKQNTYETEIVRYRNYFEEHPQAYAAFLEWKNDRETD